MKRTLLALGVLAALASPAHAATKAKRPSIEELSARIEALEANAQALRQQAADALAAAQAAQAALDEMKAQQAAAPEATAEAAPAPSGNDASSGNANAFNPAISIILNGSYTHHSLDPNAYSRAGFPLVGEGAPSQQGISLGESEVSFAENIDDKFYGQLTMSVDGEDQLGIEEAFIDTTSLPNGLSLRAGRFFSNIGYLNSHHAHTDNFFDRPLPYQAFLGNQYGDDGVQLRWVAPTDTYLEIGGEVLRGANFPAGGAGHGGVGTHTLFAHAGGDVGIENSWLAGVSVLKSKVDGGEDGFSGDTTLYIADGTWKWAPQGNFKDGGITLRGEYFVEHRDGDYVDPNAPGLPVAWNGVREGAYLEAVYRFNRTWNAGYRYDRLWGDHDLPLATGFAPDRHSFMLTWMNSEFSLFRLQFSHDQPNRRDTDNALTLQYQVSLGAHGAHKF